MSNPTSRFEAEPTPHVVIVGGGFAGVAAARALKRFPVRVTIIDRTNHNLFQPLLFQVTAGIVEPGTIAAPIRSFFRGQKNVDVRMSEVTGVDAQRQLVIVSGDAPPIHYDYLVLGTGVQSSYFGHDEWARFAPGMKSLADAEGLRRRIIAALELADQETDPRVRDELLTFVVVGAGPSGCELAGALAEHFRRGLPAEYRHVDPRGSHIVLLEAGPRALSAFSEDLARGAVHKLRGLGVDVRFGKAVEVIDADGVMVGGERIRARTVVWTAGVSASPAGRWLGVDTDRLGRAKICPDLSVPGYPQVFIVGDTAHIQHAGGALPSVATVALQSGEYAGSTIGSRVLHQAPPQPFVYADKGNMATVAVDYAIAESGRLKLSGVLGKMAWAFIHVFYLGRAEGQARLCLQWMIALLFSRTGARYIDAHAPARTDTLEGVSTPVGDLDRLRG